MKRLVIIDGKSVFYRGYYAMGNLSMSDGTPTGGIYGFAAIAMEIVRDLKPDKVVVAWDSRSSTAKRKAIFADYKAGRVKPGEDFYAQIPFLKELIVALGWNFVECEDYEADDIIGTLARQADEAGDYDTIIVSSDLDMLQIVDENTRMYRILKGFSKLEEMDVAAVEEKYGIRKAQFLDLKALKGDVSDNIPGVAGIGEKTAAKLLRDFGDLDGVYVAMERGEIGGATAGKLAAGKASAYMSRDLAKIMMDAPVRLEEMAELEVKPERILAALEKLEFRSLIRKFNLKADSSTFSSTGTLSSSKDSDPRSPEASSAMLSKADEAASVGTSYKIRNSRKEVGSPAAHSSTPVQQTLEVVQEAEDGTLVSWDVKALAHKNEEVAKRILDGGKFWDLGQGRFLLEPLARGIEHGDERTEYLAQQGEFLDFPALYKIFVQFDLPLIPVLFEMEKYGMLIDRPYFARLKAEFEREVGNLEREVWDLAGVEFNINSPAQLSDVLFSRLALSTKGIKKTARGYSTGVKELDKLEGEHGVIGAVKRYREAAKLLSTYIAPLPELADVAGRIHTTFNQNVTATGRLSSTNPNLQNIPVRTEVGKRIRTGFVAPAGRVLVSADYAQFELRLAAALAGDEGLIEVFNRGEDVHLTTAAEAFGAPVAEVTKEQRRAAKVINFGVLYGMSVRGLAQAADMSFAEAKEFIERYFEIRKKVREYLDGVLEQARTRGYVETLYGRRRPTPDVLSSNFVVRTGAERAAQNMPIQGTEADLMKKAMIGVFAALPVGAKLVLQVHDSLIVECDEGNAGEVGEILKREMEGVAPELAVKLAVEVSVGRNWGEL